ncbi:MAG: multidrug effflux MFS transporter [Pseudomonadota bacterium]
MTTSTPAAPHPGMGFKQFVALVAALMAVNALAIDSMLPALPQIGQAFGVADPNQNQLILTAYLLGFGVAQLTYGVLADRYGRKPVMLAGLAIYVVTCGLCALATSFEMMLVARALTGVGAAATRVLTVSIVRDSYSGRQMARVMSLSFIVFLAVPIIAPSLGQAIMLVAPWRWIFGVLAVFGMAVAVWMWLKLPETLHPEDRRPISISSVLAAFKVVLTDKVAMGYTLAMTVILGSLFGFLNSAQQVFTDVFDAGTTFPLIFAGIAGGMALSSLLNAQIVDRLGMRKVSHSALIGFIAIAAVHAGVALAGLETIWTFAILQAAMMFCFGMVASNFGAMAMEPLGHLAGMAASVQGFVSTVGGAILGWAIGQQFNGSTVPLTLGFALLGLGALLIVLFVENGRLFKSSTQAT